MYIGGKNMLGKIYILGAGGMAREVFQIYRSLNRETMIEGFLVNKNIENNQRPINSKLVHDVQSLQFTNEDLLINGIGNPLRKKWIEELKKNGYKFTSAIHSSATLGDELDLGVDLIVGAQTSLTCDIAIGNQVIINASCSIHHDFIIEELYYSIATSCLGFTLSSNSTTHLLHHFPVQLKHIPIRITKNDFLKNSVIMQWLQYVRSNLF